MLTNPYAYANIASHPVLSLGLTNYWKADASGSFIDEVGGNNGTITGATFTTAGKINGAYDFDGANDDIATTANIDTTINFTINMWIDLDALGGGSGFDLFTAKPAQGNNFIAANTNSGVNRLTFLWRTTGSTTINWNTVSGDVVGGFGMLTFVKSGSTLTIYWNNVSKASGSVSGDAQNSNVFQIGGDDFGSSNGRFDEISLWEKALSSGERIALLNNGSGYPYNF